MNFNDFIDSIIENGTPCNVFLHNGTKLVGSITSVDYKNDYIFLEKAGDTQAINIKYIATVLEVSGNNSGNDRDSYNNNRTFSNY